MFTRAMTGHAPPPHLSSDNDPLFTFHRGRATRRVLDVDDMKTRPLIPCSPPFVERLIGTIRREYLDDVLFWNVDDLTRKLDQFKAYDHEARVHRSLHATPAQESGKPPPPPRCTRSICLPPAVSGALSYPNGRLTRNSPLTGGGRWALCGRGRL